MTALLAVAIGAGVALFPPLLAADQGGANSKRTPHDPVACTGTDDVVLERVTISAEAVAVAVRGACDIVIKDSVIRGGESALLVEGSGNIRIIDTEVAASGNGAHITGSGDIEIDSSRLSAKTAIRIRGSGSVAAKNSVFRGKRVVRGTGRYRDRGGNRWE